MFSFLIKKCSTCNELEDALCTIDGILAQYGKNAWQNFSFLTSKPTPYRKIRHIIYYKEILNHLRWNQDFYCPYKLDQIVSRVKTISGGSFRIARRMKIPNYTTTTTSSTTSTTTSTTSSTTTTTTTTP